ncbi:hypothetical protein N7516_008248 [Penicillium verrucosum]|uniref:uncharacterized protein n=1 Tax=Penicillium verrucosum TaxID=60171 RepID=UPI0025451CA5|nr:uncharacterized protein N7516_008248 [Penicillium verrucosum]KAJ5926475.1 hypothetical protein N7516_008248 [Penicillium verrucosum]
MADNTAPRLRKRKLSEEDDCSSPRSPTRRRLTSKSAEPAKSPKSPERPKSPLPYPIPDDSSISSGGKTPSQPWDDLFPNKPPVSDDQVNEYYRKGALYEVWIADPTRDGCPCRQSELTLYELLNHSDKKKRFTCPENQFNVPPKPIHEDLQQVGHPVEYKTYRYTKLTRYDLDKDGCKRQTEYSHSIREGVIIGEDINRFGGPNWSDIALAQYKFDHPIDTLKHLYFTYVQNDETLPYMEEILYPRHHVRWPFVDRPQNQVWEYGTREYREILGTKLGKSAACLVIGAWERGTHRIARVHTLGRAGSIHLRFDIEPIPISGTA